MLFALKITGFIGEGCEGWLGAIVNARDGEDVCAFAIECSGVLCFLASFMLWLRSISSSCKSNELLSLSSSNSLLYFSLLSSYAYKFWSIIVFASSNAFIYLS